MRILSVLFVLFCLGCHNRHEFTSRDCSVTKLDGTSTIKCPDGSTSTVTDGTNGAVGQTGAQGIAGANGSNGTNGTNGLSVVFQTVSSPAGACGLNPDSSPVTGTVLMLAQDTDQTGLWASDDADQTSVLTCNGSVGATGAQGVAGTNGTNGTDGTNGTNGADGTNGSNGTNGTNGATGAQGPQGTAGTNGTNGANGTNGTNGTVLTIVQFCPGTASYPSTFPEVGVCIANSLYAVYSANDGFLSLIPPGGYTSNGIGSSCNFTVGANCTISH